MDAAMEISPAKIDGMMILPESTDPKSFRIFTTVTGTSCTMDMVTAVNIHMASLA